MYANAVVTWHEDFDIVEFARTFFDGAKRLLVVKEKGASKLHWHVHGTILDPKDKEYISYAHPLRRGEGRAKTRPVQLKLYQDDEVGEVGFRYCCRLM